MTSGEKTKFIEFLSLSSELRDMKRNGTTLQLCGASTSGDEIARSCVFSEECNYMRNYISDRKGRLLSVDFKH